MPNKDAIRLTNRTARALRESARRQRMIFRIAAVVLTLVLAVASVLLGIRSLFAVPAGVLLAVLLDALLLGTFSMGTLIGGLIVAVGMALNTRAESKEAKLLGDAHQS